MTDADFIAEICAFPAEDGPRLVYADYLDEHGFTDRAEFIRLQTRLAVIRDERSANGEKGWIKNAEQFILGQRERKLLWTYEQAWVKEIWHPSIFNNVMGWAFRRGFIESIICGWPTCRDQLDAIRAVQPITAVTLTTRPVVEWSETRGYARLDGMVEFLWAYNVIPDANGQDRRDLEIKLLTQYWPGIAFTLPTIAMPYTPTALAPDVTVEFGAAGDRYARIIEAVANSLRVPNAILHPPA